MSRWSFLVTALFCLLSLGCTRQFDESRTHPRPNVRDNPPAESREVVKRNKTDRGDQNAVPQPPAEGKFLGYDVAPEPQDATKKQSP